MKLLLKRLAQLGGCLALVLVLVVAALYWYQPKVPLVVLPAPKPVSGAAVFYNQAVAVMPELSEKEKKLLSTTPSEPLDTEAAKQLVAKCNASLQLVTQGTLQPQCEWGLDLFLVEGVPKFHVAEAVKLIKVLVVRARLRLLTGDIVGATDDFLLLFHFSRHLGEQRVLLGKLAQLVSDAIAIDLLALHLQEFDPTSLQRLSKEIAALPPSHTLREAMACEREIFSGIWYNKTANLVRAASKNSLRAQPSPSQSGKDGGDFLTLKPIQEINFRLGLRVKYVVYSIKKFEQKSLEAEKLMDLPYAEARPRFVAFEKELKRDRWINGLFLYLPGMHRRFQEVQVEMMWTILRTALDAQIHNPSSVRGELAKLRDPYDGSPIEMRDVPSGVELKLKSDPDYQPMTLMVGLAGK